MTDDQIDYRAFEWETPEELTAKILARLARIVPGEVDWLKVTLEGRYAVIRGQVYSEQAHSAASRMLAAFLVNHEPKVDIEVAGTLQPATTDWFIPDRWAETGNSGDEGQGGDSGRDPPRAQPIVRYPKVATADELNAGQDVTIEVDLPAQKPGDAIDPITLAELAPGWGAIEVLAQVSSRAFENLGGACLVTVNEDGTSTAGTVTLKLRSDLELDAEIVVEVGFSYQGRFCGSQSVNLGKLAEKAPTALALTAIEVMPVISAEAPTMTVRILGEGEELTWLWDFAPGVSGPAGPTIAPQRLQASPAQYAAGLLRDCPRMLPSDLKRRMGSIGDEIWQSAPRDFKITYQHLKDEFGSDFPIQFVLQQFHIPWELMRPDTGNHLFLTHPVGRWSLRRGDVPHLIPSGEMYSFVPEYDGNATLDAAKEEQQWLTANLGARRSTPEKAEFLKVLSGENMPKTSLVHFAGHGAAATASDNPTLEMEDLAVEIRDVDHRETMLGERDRSMVILNACEAAHVTDGLSWVDGWAPMLADRGFGAVVAPLWRVQDKAACNLVVAGLDAFYKRRETIGQAFSSARLAGSSESAAAFAFLVYGDVMARAE